MKKFEFFFLLLITYFLYVICEEKNILIVVPGLFTMPSLKNTLQNLDKLYNENKNDFHLNCVVFLTANNTDIEFWSSSIQPLRKFCNLVNNPEAYFPPQNIYMIQPSLFGKKYSHILILNENCDLNTINPKFESFNLFKIIKIMEKNNLTVASTLVNDLVPISGNKRHIIMTKESENGNVGYVVNYISFQCATILTSNSYIALWELLYPDINPTGIGYDLWYDSYAKDRVEGHKIGLISIMMINLHQLPIVHRGPEERWIERAEKWKSLVKQEKFYFNHFTVSLNRKHFGKSFAYQTEFEVKSGADINRFVSILGSLISPT